MYTYSTFSIRSDQCAGGSPVIMLPVVPTVTVHQSNSLASLIVFTLGSLGVQHSIAPPTGEEV